MDSRLDGPREKIKRANEHIVHLADEVGTFLRDQPYSGVVYMDAKSREWVLRAKVNRHPPLRWSVIAGDVVHNLRSSLDLLAWKLVETNGGRPSEATGYPFCRSAKELESALKGKVQGASQAAQDIIRATQPYEGGNDDLWKVHRLSIVDKHRLLVTVGAAFSRMGSIDGITYVALGPRSFPLEDGAEVYRAPETDREKQVGFAFDIAFGEGEVVQGEPLVPTLLDLAQVVERTVESFTPVL